MGVYEISPPFYNIHRYSDTSKVKQLMRPYDGTRTKTKKVDVTQIHDTGGEPHEMEAK